MLVRAEPDPDDNELLPLTEQKQADTDPTVLSNREQLNLEITPGEITTAKVAAFASAVGNAGIISSVWLFAITPAEQVGLSVTAVSAAASIGILAAVSLATVLISIPLTYYAYEDYMIEAKALEEELIKTETIRKQHQEDILIQLLRLKCLLNEEEFIEAVKSLALEEGVKKQELLDLVDQISSENRFQNLPYHFNDKQELAIGSQEEKEAKPQYTLQSLFQQSDLIQNANVTKNAIQQFKANDRYFDKKLDACFEKITSLPTHYTKPIMYGVAGAMMMAGTLFGTSWTFASIAISAGLCASIPVIGWAILALGCLVASIAVGVWIGKSKNKNMQREELQHRLTKKNQQLETTKTQVSKLCLKKDIENNHKRSLEAKKLKDDLENEKKKTHDLDAQLKNQDNTILELKEQLAKQQNETKEANDKAKKYSEELQLFGLFNTNHTNQTDLQAHKKTTEQPSIKSNY